MHYITKSTVRFIKKKNLKTNNKTKSQISYPPMFLESFKKLTFIASPLVIQFAVKGHELKYTVYAKSRKRGK